MTINKMMQDESVFKDLRTSPRWSGQYRVRLKSKDHENPYNEASTVNVSLDGLCLSLDHENGSLEKNVQLELFLNETESLPLNGEVVWEGDNSPHATIGIKFKDLSEEEKEIILQIIGGNHVLSQDYSHLDMDDRYIPRWKASKKVFCRRNGKTAKISGITDDMSMSGLSIWVDEEIRKNEEIQIALHLGNDCVLETLGKVVWARCVRRKHFIGVIFTHLTPQLQELLLEYAYEIGPSE
ncbi:MAG: PilZ domain-containing protein [Candidatus Omnitrophica bacterium]|nr:PilZ domain-containing protein [Candidatus Omnitrophota bacterium]